MLSMIVPSSSTRLYSARSYLATTLSTSASLLTKTSTRAVSAPGSVSLAQAGSAATPNSNAALAATVSDRFIQILLILSTLAVTKCK